MFLFDTITTATTKTTTTSNNNDNATITIAYHQIDLSHQDSNHQRHNNNYFLQV